MKANIHPQFYTNAQVACACGNTFTTGSTMKSITVEICSKCHPFYTGEQRFIDTKGKVDSFIKKQKMAEEYRLKYAGKKQKKEQRTEKKTKTLKELLSEM